MIEIIPCDIILHITVGWKINPLSSVVSSAVLGSKVSTATNVAVDLPATVVGKDGKERAATKPKTQILDSYLRCYTQEEIAEKEGLSDSGAVAHILEGLLKNGNPAELQQSPMALHQVDFEIPLYNYALSSTSANLASSTAAGGNKRRGPSLYTSHVVKRAILRVATSLNRNLGRSSLWVVSYIPLFLTQTWQRAFVTSAVNDKKDNLSTTLTKSNTSKSVWQISAEPKGL